MFRHYADKVPDTTAGSGPLATSLGSGLAHLAIALPSVSTSPGVNWGGARN